MLLIERYIIAEIRRPVSIMVGILTFVFASYSAERYLTQAVDGTLALQSVLDMVVYKVVIALEMLVPVALYTSVAIALGRLYHDSEIIAIVASGASPLRLYRAVALLALPIAIAVNVLSVYGRPWAYTQTYRLEQQSRAAMDVSHLLPQRFNLNQDNGRMILAERIDHSTGNLENALIYDPGEGKSRVFRSNVARVVDPNPKDPIVALTHGTSYSLEHNGTQDVVSVFDNLLLHLKPIEPEPENKRKSTSTGLLSVSPLPDDQAELQWRETRGVSAILLALLAVPLSRAAPRKGRFSTLLPIAMLFAVIFYASNICRTLVANTALPLMPGVWLVPLLMGLVLLIFIARDLAIVRLRSK
ncbi:LPS export ABC transporter permease LptF [Pseudomonas synxantha]|uniref:Lipopolysaccharide export system permease protein LptF n=1 Tax=Pseudomonas synxantha TaxID=47883 RepID=A0ABS0UEJ3_9PSED|nr:LPS export ABC transporter permease LptF [Pseudomonas synxantha]MBI6564013.1 LPS export ABC transporter permease LptF [Pseudomonas synxantha]MBI6580378.1 LPS export ABC transporter permease LptF [Pseudomonas synxantha]MBI6642116.1 LPS export ABC transporter permease LptF [Pseudomonas synxantha]